MKQNDSKSVFIDELDTTNSPQFGDAANWPHYYIIERLIKHLEESVDINPSLNDLAKMANMSPFYLQRIFAEYVGLSPKQFLQFHRANLLKSAVNNGLDLWSQADKIGLKSSSRTYELLIKAEAITPSSLQKKGEGLVLDYDFGLTPFGKALFVVSSYGLTHLFFHEKEEEALAQVKAELPLSNINKKVGLAGKWIEAIFLPNQPETKKSLYLHLRGTPFQLKVWKALLAIPESHFSSYGSIAKEIGQEKAFRAVGTAVGKNAISWLVPCHRVLRQSGVIGDYRWGSNRKKIMLFCESNAIF